MPNFPVIKIEQNNAKIAINSKPAKIAVKQPKAELSIHQEHLQVQLKTTYPKVQIDQTKAWSALGKRPSLELTKVIYSETRRIVLDTIARINAKGDRLAAIHQKQDPIPEMAKENMLKFNEFYFEGEPSYDNVEINVIPGSLEIGWQGGKVINNTKINKPQITYQPGNVDIFLLQKNSIKFSVSNIDKKV